MTPKQEEVLRRRFAIEREKETLEEIGQWMDLTREAVRQIERKAVEQLVRAYFQEQGSSKPCDRCGKPAGHVTYQDGEETHLCCDCHMADGGLPADWHARCMEIAGRLQKLQPAPRSEEP